MKEKPIIFSTPMVKAILEGTKTQTRRIIKTPPCEIHEHGKTVTVTRPREYKNEYARLCPYAPYNVGDILWVRETFAHGNPGEYIYKADPMFDDCGPGDIGWGWKPSIHLPREAARLFLEVKSVRVERLLDINEANAKAEGIKRKYDGCLAHKNGKPGPTPENCPIGCSCLNHRELFFKLWDTLNAKRGYPWDSNPWVWVYEFMRVENDIGRNSIRVIFKE